MAVISIPMPFMIVASVMTTFIIGAYFVSTMLVVIRTFFVVTTRLLVMCRSIKVRRLFMFMAEKHGHPWVSDLDVSRLDLGKGKRMIVPKGRFDRKYQITVPRVHYLPSNGSS